MAVDVKIYSTPLCGYCRRAEALLDSKGVAYERIEVGGNPELRQWLRQVTGRHTVPQIFIGGESIGGYDELSGLDRRGELDRLLSGG